MKVSILISTYGTEEWRQMALDRAVPSAQAQDAHEIIVVHQPEGNIASCRNEAAAQATGDWLLMLDGDDELRPGFLKAIRRVEFNYRRRNQLVNPDRTLYTPAVSYIRDGRPRSPMVWPQIPLQQGNWLIIGTIVPRALFHEVGGFDDWPHGLEDWALFSKMWKAGCEIIVAKHAVYVCYVNHQSKHRTLMRDVPQHVYWHQKAGHSIWPDWYDSTTADEDAVQRLLDGRKPRKTLRMLDPNQNQIVDGALVQP